MGEDAPAPGSPGGLTYREAGVDRDAAAEAVRRIAGLAQATGRAGARAGIGGFGAAVPLDLTRYRRPVLVSGTDGVGTKLRIAFLLGRHDTVGIDCVAMSADDVAVHGAEPLFFLDYLAVGRMDPDLVEAVVGGVAEGCRRAGCALVGGETAEMPGFYAPGEYDLVGFCVGVVEAGALLDGSGARPGDVVLGFASSGLHANGYSLARRALLEAAGYRLDAVLPELGRTLGEELLEPTRIYAPALAALFREFNPAPAERPAPAEGAPARGAAVARGAATGAAPAIRGAAHITGGGLVENLPRALPDGLGVDLEPWPVPPIFELVRRAGNVPREDWFRTFNLGIGMAVVVAPAVADAVAARARALGERVHVIGRVVERAAGARVRLW